MKYLLGKDSITVFMDGKPFTVSRTARTFDAVLSAVRNNDPVALKNAVEIKKTIFTTLSKSGKVKIEGDLIKYGDRVINGLVTSRIFEMLELGLNINPMLKFLENLMENPSMRAVEEAFGFAEACNLPITEDGCLLAYKRVRADYMDVYSGTMDNSIGKIPEMPRNMVDDNKDRTCSRGLHFCSYSYLSSFSGARVVVVKVNPRDIVSIPSDYNNAKGRACRYEVVSEIELDEKGLPEQELDQSDAMHYNENKIGQPSLSDDVVQSIKMDIEDGETMISIAKRYGTSARTVARIRDGKVAAYASI